MSEVIGIGAAPRRKEDLRFLTGRGNYVADIERSLLKSALAQADGVQTHAAEALKISYRSFRHLMKKYEL